MVTEAAVKALVPHNVSTDADSEGYQQSEFGPIPASWTLASLGDTCRFENGDRGINYPSKSDFLPVGLAFVNAGHLDDGRIRKEHLDYISRNHFERLGGGKFSPGDILFCLRGSLGKFAEVDTDLSEGAIASSLIIVRPKKSVLIRGFLTAYLKSDLCSRMIEKWAGGAAQPNLGGRDLARFLIPLPPTLAEQKAIAEAFWEADGLIESLEQLVTKKRQTMQGAMQDLLSGRKRLPGFSGEWDYIPFGSAFDFLPTATNSRADLGPDGDAYYVHYGDIHTRFNAHLDFNISAPPRIARAKCPAAAPLRNGDWIMADASEDFDGVGKSVEVRGLDPNDVAVAGLHTFLMRERVPTFAPGFKGHLGAAEFLRRQYMRVVTGMKVYGVSKTALRDLLVPVPPADEQAALVEVLDDFNAEIAALEIRLEKVRLIKQGMMQELLTGKVRLV